MKSISFQRNKSLLRVVNERKIKKRRNWDRIVYLVLLVLFLLFAIYYLTNKLFYIHADGHVIIESTKIRLTDDARLIDLYVHEGDSVAQNDTLFSYALDIDDDLHGSGTGASALTIGGIKGENNDLWYYKEMYNLKKSIAMNNVKIKENEDLVLSFEKELKRLTNEVILDVLPKTRLDAVQNEILKLKSQNSALKSENTQLAGLMANLKPLGPKSSYSVNNVNIKNKAKGAGANSGNYHVNPKLFFTDEMLTEEKFFRSPMNGVITRVYVKSTETALKSEDIMSIHQDHPAFIKAFFDQEDVKHFAVGDKFTITFPDGSKSTGVLKRFYIATYILPEEFQKKYEPTTRSIAGDIYPLNEEEMKKWKVFYKMSVDISKSKY